MKKQNGKDGKFVAKQEIKANPERKNVFSGLSLYEIKRKIHNALFGNRQPKRVLKQKTKTTIFIWSMLALPLLNLLIFWVYVNIDSILMAFQKIEYDEQGNGVEVWTFDQFIRIYQMLTTKSPEYDIIRFASNTFKYWLLSTVWAIPHSVLLTYVFHKKLAGTKFFRVVLYLPVIICAVVLSVIFEYFIDAKGVLGYILRHYFEVSRVPNWFGEVEWSTPTLLFYSFFFGFSGQYILYSGAMAKISKEVQEAAVLDGVNMWQELWHIYIPLMWPTISMTIVTSFAGIFGASGSIMLFTPETRTNFTLGYWMFYMVEVAEIPDLYLPSALGLVFTLIAYPLCLIVRKIVTSFWSDAE